MTYTDEGFFEAILLPSFLPNSVYIAKSDFSISQMKATYEYKNQAIQQPPRPLFMEIMGSLYSFFPLETSPDLFLLSH